MTNILVITGDPIGAKMAGPAIRAWNIARVLGSENEVVLLTTTSLDPGFDSPFPIREVRPGENRKFADLERWADVIVFQGHAMHQFDALRSTSKVIVADIYDPMHLEMLEQGRELPRATWKLRVATATRVLNQQLARGDFFLCASERQRLFYLGQLAALGRVNPDTYEYDPHLERLLAVVPFGLDAEAPLHTRTVLRGVVRGISKGDKILLWGGGVYSWFDPKTLIRAVAELALVRRNVRLYFLGTRHPGVEKMGIVAESRELAQGLGVLDSAVFFNEDWVDYGDRQNFLVESDAGVSTHHSHVETTFSFRTRILDYLWAGLPIIVTEGDSFAEIVAREGLGAVVPVGDVGALTSALDRALFDESFIKNATTNARRVAEEYKWERVLSPLVEFVRHPSRAADAETVGSNAALRWNGGKPYGIRHELTMAWHHFRHSGMRVVFAKVVKRFHR